MSAEPLERFTPYSNVSAMFADLPKWMDEYDAERIMAYQVYEQIYWNVPETFKLVARGAENMPIYVPTARVIVDTTNRYVGKNWMPTIDVDFGSPADQVALKQELTKLFRREKMWSKFNAAKRMGLIRGDWVIHVMGNTEKPAGRRLKIETVDPAAYFPVTHPDDPDRIIGIHLVEQIKVGDEWLIKRQTYQKGLDPVNNDGSDTTIYNSVATFKTEDWREWGSKAVTVIKPPTALPPQITSMPVYHIKNIVGDGDPYGSSELRGFERIMAGINQAVSDEELVLAVEGLGVYWTDAGPPRDTQGNIMDWQLGPARVLEVPDGKKMNRLGGVGSITPYTDHIKMLCDFVKEGSGTPDVAIGKLDVAVAESGVSLALQMGPMLAKADERDESIADSMDQFLWDLSTMWLPAYEALAFDAVAVSDFGDKMPANREKDITEILNLVTAGIASTEWARGKLAAMGFDFSSNEGELVAKELEQRQMAIDPFAARMAAEVEHDDQTS